MKAIKKFLSYVAGALFAYFFPELGTEGWVDAFVSFAAFAPLVVLLAAELNTLLKWEDLKAWLGTGLTSFALAYLAYFLKLGIMESVIWWHPAVFALGAFAVSAWGFSLPVVKAILATIFDYSFKKRK